MKHILHRLISWWFVTMVPVYVPSTGIRQREAMRKRRLLSILMVLFLPIAIVVLLVEIFMQIKGIQIGLTVIIMVSLSLSLWINQRGYLKCASLFYILAAFLITAVIISTFSLSVPLFSFCLWVALLVLSVIGALFLPVWGSLALGGAGMIYMGWFVFVERHEQIAIYLKSPHEQLMFFLLTCADISMIAVFSAISTIVNQKAVIQADRAVELEQANQALSVLHIDLTDTHASLEVAYASLEVALATIQMQALTDALTNLPNHRAVMEQFARDIELVRRHRLPFSLLFLDADHFKHVNDTYGHAVGDRVLCQIGERAGCYLRRGDTLGRFGGEEFVVLLFEAAASEASSVAERIRIAVAAEPMAFAEVAGGIPMTVSIGRATYGEDGESEQELLVQADQAMYVAKRMGRNQVCSATIARQLSADPTQTASWDEQTRIEAMQREGVSPEQIKSIAQAIMP